MPSKNLTCKIDQRSIDKYVKEQRLLGERLTLSDETCGGLKLVINSKSCSWTYSYRKRGYLNGGKRHPQRTMKLGDPVSMSPAEARLAAEPSSLRLERVSTLPSCPERKIGSARSGAQEREGQQADLCAMARAVSDPADAVRWHKVSFYWTDGSLTGQISSNTKVELQLIKFTVLIT